MPRVQFVAWLFVLQVNSRSVMHWQYVQVDRLTTVLFPVSSANLQEETSTFQIDENCLADPPVRLMGGPEKSTQGQTVLFLFGHKKPWTESFGSNRGV